MVVENTGTVEVNYRYYNTYGKRYDGRRCDPWPVRNCEAYFYFKYRECYGSFYSCSSYISIYYYAGKSSMTMNKYQSYTTSNSFSVSYEETYMFIFNYNILIRRQDKYGGAIRIC